MIRIKTRWRYFLYICQHKWFVLIECFHFGILLQGITHDLSKFYPSEFFPYAEKFFSGDYAYKYFEVEDAFNFAWLLHQHRNKHHWDYWVNSKGINIPMPRKYILEMICDWKAMGRKFKDSAEEYYLKHKHEMKLHLDTIEIIEEILNIT